MDITRWVWIWRATTLPVDEMWRSSPVALRDGRDRVRFHNPRCPSLKRCSTDRYLFIRTASLQFHSADLRRSSR